MDLPENTTAFGEYIVGEIFKEESEGNFKFSDNNEIIPIVIKSVGDKVENKEGLLSSKIIFVNAGTIRKINNKKAIVHMDDIFCYVAKND